MQNICSIIAYGYSIDASQNIIPASLHSRLGHGIGEDGLCIQGIDSFIQFDLADFIRLKTLKCEDPTIKIGSIQLNEGFEIYGSNQLGLLGTLLYTYINTTNPKEMTKELIIPSYNSAFASLIIYGMIPYRFISVKAQMENNIVVINLSFSHCN